MKTTTCRKPVGKGVCGFFRNNLFVILAFIIPAAILGGVFALRSFYPFGNRMIMVVDSWHQYYPFLAEYQQMLKEGSSFMYSWNTGGGSSFIGVIANYIASPLYLLSALIPSGTPWLQMFLAFTVVVRVGCAGMFFAIFLRKVFGKHDLSLVMFSLMYAFCGYILGYYWNMMWLDTVALTPLVIAGVVEVLRDKKFRLYIISLALSVMFSFYIGYMVCLFVLIVSICYTIVSFVSFRESLKNAGKMLGYTAIALMITAVITLPSYLCLNASDSAGAAGAFPTSYTINYAYGYEAHNILNTLLAIGRTATNMLALTKPIVFDQGLPNIACGVLTLVLIPFYFTTKKISLREKIVSGSLCVFFLLSFVINQLNFIWHGMSTPAMVYYRWSFIFSFVMIVLAYRAFMLIDSFTKKTFAFSAGLLVLYLALSFVLQKKICVAITLAGAVVVLAGFVLYRKKKLRYRTLSILLCLFVFCEMSAGAFYGVRTVKSSKIDDYPKNNKAVSQLLEVAGVREKDEIFRTEFTQPFTLNDPDLYSVYGISTFNSMVDSSYADALKELGLAASKINNRYVYHENTPVANIFLNIKYLVSREDMPLLDTESAQLVATADECGIYENKYYVPMGFVTSSALLEGYSSDSDWNFPGDVQNWWFSTATGVDEDVLSEVEPLTEINCTYPDNLTAVNNPSHRYRYDLSKVSAPEATQDEAKNTPEGAPMWIEYEIPEDGSYYGTFRSTSDKETTVIINGDEENPLELIQDYTNLTAIGALHKGDKVRVEMEAEYGKKSNVICKLVKVNEDVLKEGTEILRENTMTLSEWSDRGIKGTINAEKSGLFYTSVLYTEGWKVYVDGKETEITPVSDTFIAFEISQGEHEIELKFTTPGLYAGAVITCVGIAVFAVLCVVSSKIRRKKAQEAVCEEAHTSDEESAVTEKCTDTHQ